MPNRHKLLRFSLLENENTDNQPKSLPRPLIHLIRLFLLATHFFSATTQNRCPRFFSSRSINICSRFIAFAGFFITGGSPAFADKSSAGKPQNRPKFDSPRNTKRNALSAASRNFKRKPLFCQCIKFFPSFSALRPKNYIKIRAMVSGVEAGERSANTNSEARLHVLSTVVQLAMEQRTPKHIGRESSEPCAAPTSST